MKTRNTNYATIWNSAMMHAVSVVWFCRPLVFCINSPTSMESRYIARSPKRFAWSLLIRNQASDMLLKLKNWNINAISRVILVGRDVSRYWEYSLSSWSMEVLFIFSIVNQKHPASILPDSWTDVSTGLPVLLWHSYAYFLSSPLSATFSQVTGMGGGVFYRRCGPLPYGDWWYSWYKL